MAKVELVCTVCLSIEAEVGVRRPSRMSHKMKGGEDVEHTGITPVKSGGPTYIFPTDNLSPILSAGPKEH